MTEQIESTFVVRVKKNLQFRQISWERRLPKNVTPTQPSIGLVVYKSSKAYPIPLRKVACRDEERQREFIFLTNNLDLPALIVADRNLTYRQN